MGSIGFGEWLFPNGTMITENRVTGGMYWVRKFQTGRLYRQGDIQNPLGTYCCRIPNRHGDVVSVCANLTGEFTINQCSYCYNCFVTANTIRCPSDSVMAPTNGMVSYSSPVENGSYVYGTVATFSCSPGFSLDGPSTTSTRTCETEQGLFSGTTPSCIGEGTPAIMYCNYHYKITAITCSALLAIGNGTIVYSSNMIEPYDHETTATYECGTGYEITSGDKKRNCTGDGTTRSGDWNGSPAMCSRKLRILLRHLCDVLLAAVSCGQVPSDTNASPGTPTRLTFRGTVTYSCNDDYALFGNATSACQANATWSRPPECRGTCAHSLFRECDLYHTLQA